MANRDNLRAATSEPAGLDLHLDLSGPGGLRTGLTRSLRDAVRDGRLTAGTLLPPVRSLAADLGLARNTVSAAYAELVAEGWLVARQGSGTRVATLPAPLPPIAEQLDTAPPSARYNLYLGTPDTASFPRGDWLASMRRAVSSASPDAFAPGDPRGHIELRKAVAEYLARSRGVRASADRIVITTGTSHSLHLLAEVIGGPIAVESYGMGPHRELLTAASRAETRPIPVDKGGAVVDELGDERGVLLTPAHQFPTGVALRPSRRTAVVGWARSQDAVVIEDDYDGEFRYDREPVGALQGLAPDHVAYVGSVSKSLSPAMRLGWIVLPDALLEPVVRAKGIYERWVSTLEQLALADFISSGHYDRHVRRMRQDYRERRGLLKTVLAERAPHLRMTGIAAGMHAVLTLPPDTESYAVSRARRAGVGLWGLHGFRHPDSTDPVHDAITVNYGRPPRAQLPAALSALLDVLV